MPSSNSNFMLHNTFLVETIAVGTSRQVYNMFTWITQNLTLEELTHFEKRSAKNVTIIYLTVILGTPIKIV